MEPKVRVSFTLPKSLTAWLDQEAKEQTEANGGSIRDGGGGVVLPAHVVAQLIQKERDSRP